MEPRRVVLVAEVMTDLPVSKLRQTAALAAYIGDSDGVMACHALLVHQMQVNVVEKRKPPKKAKGKRK